MNIENGKKNDESINEDVIISPEKVDEQLLTELKWYVDYCEKNGAICSKEDLDKKIKEEDSNFKEALQSTDFSNEELIEAREEKEVRIKMLEDEFEKYTKAKNKINEMQK